MKVNVLINSKCVLTKECTAGTWGELKPQISSVLPSQEYNVTLYETMADLVHDEATLPLNDEISLFIYPKHQKGGYSYKEAKDKIKLLRLQSEGGKEFFGDYTHDSTEVLNDKLNKWENLNPVVSDPKPITFNKPTIMKQEIVNKICKGCNKRDEINNLLTEAQEKFNSLIVFEKADAQELKNLDTFNEDEDNED